MDVSQAVAATKAVKKFPTARVGLKLWTQNTKPQL